MFKYYGKNIRPFTAVNQCNFGRKVIFTNKSKITKLNIVEELSKALSRKMQKKSITLIDITEETSLFYTVKR